jgi:hypothetical protein
VQRIDRLDVFNRTLQAWERCFPSGTDSAYGSIREYLTTLIEIESRSRKGNWCLSVAEETLLRTMQPTWVEWVFSGAQLANLLCDTQHQASRLWRRYRLRQWLRWR